MLSLDESQLFDAWRGRTPRGEFGELRDVGPDFDEFVMQACNRAGLSFGVVLELGAMAAPMLDKIIDSMWATNWSPSNSAFDLFVRDFGVILVASMHRSLGGRLISRGSDSFIHLSLWWQDDGFEAFPVHVIAKRLMNDEPTTTVASFYKNVESSIRKDTISS